MIIQPAAAIKPQVCVTMPVGFIVLDSDDLELPELPAPLHLTSDIAFTDGFRTGVDHDWSHATFGVSIKIGITDNLSFVPGIYHQITMDESINPDKDVTYCVLSMKYKF